MHAAQGYARASNKVGVVTVTSGPAATNVITGVSDANVDSTPLVVITGQVGVNSLGSDAFQETDVMGITLPITKWAYQVRTAEQIPWAVARAFFIASTGRPGSVVLDITKDAQIGMMEWGNYVPKKYIRSYNPDPDLLPSDLIAAATLINRAERPMILSGHGVMISEAENDLIALAEKADIPVATTLAGVLLYGSLEELDELLEVVDIELGVELHAALLFHVVHDFLEGIDVGLRFGLHAEHNVAIHLDETTVAVPGEAGVAALLGEACHGGVVHAEVEDGVHHAGH